MLHIPPNIHIPEAELEFTFVRSSGPGGQNVNKVNSKAVLRWNVRASTSLPPAVRDRFLQRFGSRLTVAGELIVTSQRHRDQGRNAEDCLEKAREMLQSVAKPPKTRRKTKPSRASQERRRRGHGSGGGGNQGGVGFPNCERL